MAQYYEVLDDTGLTKAVETAAASETVGYIYTLADTDTEVLPFIDSGLYLVEDQTAGNSAIIQVVNTTTTKTVVKLNGGAAGIAIIEGTNDRVNIYVKAGVLELECQMTAGSVVVVKPLNA